MLGFLFGSSASESEKNAIKKKCSTRESAVAICLRGNPASACDNFEQDLDLCKGRIVCPEVAAEFSRCTHLVINHTGTVATSPDCTKPLLAMRKCLKSKGV